MAERSREIRLAARPQGFPKPEDFEHAETVVPEPGDGQLLVRNAYMSVDPYMRGRMNDVRSYVPPYQIGEPLEGGAVGQVVASRSDDVPEGAWVSHNYGWREWAVVEARHADIVDPELAPVSTSQGVLGMPGLTAYVGLLDVGRAKEGETVLVTAAAGAVGQVVGQVAKARGMRVVGSVGSEEKKRFVVEELGFDAAYDYKQDDVRAALREHCPDRIDVLFENVGGWQLELTLGWMADFGRIPVCGMISQYNLEQPEPGPRNLALLVRSRLEMKGFLVFDYRHRRDDFLAEVGPWVRDGRLKYREDVAEGIENAPQAFIGMLRGENLGKQLVKIGPGPGEDGPPA